MNILNYINIALTAFAYDAEAFLLTKSRAANEELEHTKPVIVVFPDFSAQNKLSAGFEILKTYRYNIEFKQLDEWDNSDSNPDSYGASTLDNINEMERLADSVFSYIAINSGGVFPDIQNGTVSWRMVRPIVREGNGTMSGVIIQLEF